MWKSVVRQLGRSWTPNGQLMDQGTATKIAATLNRRAFLSRAAEGVCGVIGVTFLVSVASDATLHAASHQRDFRLRQDTAGYAAGPCTHPDDSTRSGKYCGMSGVSCDGFANANCPGCLNADGPDKGCPKGTKKGDDWWACCACASGVSGENVTYFDCCGNNLDPKCNGCTAGPSANMENALPCSRTNNGTWCGAQAPGSYQCSYAWVSGDCNPGNA
jgi:hypothetical protein